MIAIFKKELKGYLTSMIGYVFIFFILLLEGIYFTAYNIQGTYPVFGSTLNAITFIFLILVPVLTMKTIAEERKQKTDQMLLTAPISVTKIIVGKYLALITVYLIPVVVICFYPLIMGKFGAVSYPMAYTAIFGFALLGFAQIAIGVFLSCITENPVISAVLTFIALFVCFMISAISSMISDASIVSLGIYTLLVVIVTFLIYSAIRNVLISAVIGILGEAALITTYVVKSTLFESSIQKFLAIFDISSHFDNFTNGILDIQGVVYFLSIIVIFTFLSVQSITKRRWN
ncbi:MAG: ABC transporter [Clostridia bacterium]|nr:ABC transporter [Clostridia bacterium]